MSSEFIEIERKFLLNSFPTDLPLKVEYQAQREKRRGYGVLPRNQVQR